MRVKASEAAWGRKPGPRFCLSFAGWLGLMAVGFEWTRSYLVYLFMYPISHSAAFILDRLGIEAHLGKPDLTAGMCELAVARVTYQVTFECTGIFALAICLASVMAFPAPAACKTRGIALVLPAFLCYSTIRLVVMGMVARFAPSQIELFHIYVMVLVNIGFALLLWLYWLRKVVFPRERNGP